MGSINILIEVKYSVKLKAIINKFLKNKNTPTIDSLIKLNQHPVNPILTYTT